MKNINLEDKKATIVINYLEDLKENLEVPKNIEAIEKVLRIIKNIECK